MSIRLRSVLAALLALLGSLLLMLLASEGLSRLIFDPPRYHREPVVLDPELGFRGIPDFADRVEDGAGGHDLVLNRDGLRGRGLPSQPADTPVRRIAFLGDSFLVGEVVPEAELVTSRVEAELRAQGVAAEVYNLSAIDWGTGQQLLYLDRVGPVLAPETVLLAFYVGNDVVNNSLTLANTTTNSPGDPIRPYVIPESAGLRVEYVDSDRAWWRRHSRLFATLERNLAPFGSSRPGGARTRRERVAAGKMPLEELELFRAQGPSPRWQEAWQHSFALLGAMQARCAELGARLVVLVIPSVHQVQQTEAAVRFGVELRAFANRPLSSLIDWNEPDRRLARFFRSSGIEAILLLDRLRDAARDSDEIYAWDGHLGAEGHAVLARAALEALRGEVPEPVAATGGPVPWPVAGLGSRVLDFSRESHSSRLGSGWYSWAEDSGSRSWGWAASGIARVALEADRGPLLLRGSFHPDRSGPVEVGVQVLGAGTKIRRFEGEGPFELRFAFGPDMPRSESGHVTVMIVSRAAPGLYVEAVGFVHATQGRSVGSVGGE